MISFQTFLAEQTGNNNLVTDFFLLARNSATYAHYLHLNSDSYAEHAFLDEYYKNIIALTDKFIESFIGKFGKLSSMPTDAKYLSITEFRDWVETNRENITDAPELQSIVDEILVFCNAVAGKLENLK